MHVIAIDPGSGEIESMDIALDDARIEMIKMKLLSNGDLLLTGLSSEAEKGVNGSFNIKFNDNFEEEWNSTQEFPENFITQTW